MKRACSGCGDGPHDADWRERNSAGDALLWWCMGCGKWWCAPCSGTSESPECDECAFVGRRVALRTVRGHRIADVRLNSQIRLVADCEDGRTRGLRCLPRRVA